MISSRIIWIVKGTHQNFTINYYKQVTMYNLVGCDLIIRDSKPKLSLSGCVYKIEREEV